MTDRKMARHMGRSKILHAAREFAETLERRVMLTGAGGGAPDVNFGTYGEQYYYLSGNSRVFAVGLQSSGQIIVAMTSTGQPANLGSTSPLGVTLMRANSNGSEDYSFGENGIAYSSAAGTAADAIKVLSDDSILVCGASINGNLGISHFTSNGVLDSTFGSNGISVADVGGGGYGSALALTPTGNIVVSGYKYTPATSHYDAVIAEWNSDGTLDTNFGTSGVFTIHLSDNLIPAAICALTSGEIVVAGARYGPQAGAAQSGLLMGVTSSGVVDSTFGTSGFAASAGATAYAGLAVAPAGQILAAGQTGTAAYPQALLARYTPSGALDSAFGQGGIAGSPPDGDFSAVAIAANGQIVAAGSISHYSGATRYNADGSVDTSYGNSDAGGIAAMSVVLQPDGKAILGGSSAVVRLTATTPFSYCNISGMVFIDANDNGAQDPGETGVAGATVYLDANDNNQWDMGEVTATTDSSGAYSISGLSPAKTPLREIVPADLKQTTSISFPIELAVGQTTVTNIANISDPSTAAPALDATFGDGGSLVTHIPVVGGPQNAIATFEESSGGLLIVAEADTATQQDIALLRYNADGSLDRTFGTSGIAITPISTSWSGAVGSAAMDSFGRIVVGVRIGPVGGSTIGVARFNPNGTLDPSFGNSGIAKIFYMSDFAVPTSLAITSDGSIMVAGAWYVYRLTAAGKVDSTFNAGHPPVGGGTAAMSLQPDGKVVLVGGGLVNVPGDDGIIERLNVNGSLDTSFASTGYVYTPTPWHSVAAQSDGKIVVGGQGGPPRFQFRGGPLTLERFTTTGTPDPTFGATRNGLTTLSVPPLSGPISDAPSVANALTVLPDGRLLVVGEADRAAAGVGDFFIAELLPSGSVDTVFAAHAPADVLTDNLSPYGDSAVDILMLSNGNALIVGSVSAFNGIGSYYEFDGVSSYLGQFSGVGLVEIEPGPYPISQIVAPSPVPEGASVMLDGSQSSEAGGSIVSYQWDLNYNGSSFNGTVSGKTVSFSAAGLDGPSMRTIALKVTDGSGQSVIATATVNITDAPPTAKFTGGSVALGFAGKVAFSSQGDPSPADVAAGFKYSYDFNNDGKFEIADSSSASTTVPATYLATAGNHTIRGRIKDKDGGFTDYTATITVTAPTKASISGTVFADNNGNAKLDAGEVGVSGRKVYIDKNKNGVLDVGEPVITTSTSGAFTFTGLAAGTYRVRDVLPSGWRRTSPTAGYFDVTVSAGQTVTGKNFAETTRGLISGIVFKDANGNGIKDSTEVGLLGWVVFLDTNNNGKLDAGELSFTTGSDGKFSFVVPAGTYHLREVLKSGFKHTAPSTGVYNITLGSGQTTSGKNFGDK